ncbi:hypothetical protein CRG98_018462 [Punica granatum]|uniref:Uncharacterized protein n=1 Tax=Punica granatum TaxID=22663 RepID=A0A2I0JY10_PUNGR|nr:hypothetical protein CRG98_018462 [Punica granatum]
MTWLCDVAKDQQEKDELKTAVEESSSWPKAPISPDPEVEGPGLRGDDGRWHGWRLRCMARGRD